MSSSLFSADYASARARFLLSAERAGAQVTSYFNPTPGPDGQSLYCDVARLGPSDPKRWLFAVSATHGVEGFVGSAAQINWLERNVALPADVGVLLIHAINPFGFAWLKRVNEDNVDLNRNHIDHAAGHPENKLYDEAAEFLVPPDWFGPGRVQADAALKAFVVKHGPQAILRACSGQYDYPKGIFYGGQQPVWSHRILREVAQHHAANAEVVAYVDFHTGLGPYGHGEAICYHGPETSAYTFARIAYGEQMTSPHLGNSASPVNHGKTGYGVQMALPETLVSCITLEFGTYDNDFVISTIRADAWLDAYGDKSSPEAAKIKADIRRAFYPDQDDWREMVTRRSQEVLDGTLRALQAWIPALRT